MQMASKELEVKDDVKVAEECKALMATEEELAENDTKVLLPLMEKFSRSYDQKAESLSDIDWLKGTLKEELSEKSDEEIRYSDGGLRGVLRPERGRRVRGKAR